MMALAIWDTILLWCAFFYYGVKQMPLGVDQDFINQMTPWFHAFSQIANTASVSLLLSPSLPFCCWKRDRFLPLFHEQLNLRAYKIGIVYVDWKFAGQSPTSRACKLPLLLLR
jgi:hypothetical protein